MPLMNSTCEDKYAIFCTKMQACSHSCRAIWLWSTIFCSSNGRVWWYTCLI